MGLIAERRIIADLTHIEDMGADPQDRPQLAAVKAWQAVHGRACPGHVIGILGKEEHKRGIQNMHGQLRTMLRPDPAKKGVKTLEFATNPLQVLGIRGIQMAV